MTSPSLSRHEWKRLRQLRAGMLGTLAALLAALWMLQVGRGDRYESNIERQSLRRVRLPGARGRIYDRHFVCLADNAPTFGIALFP